jgi:hypothetical protein
LAQSCSLGKEFKDKLRCEPNSRGCELRVLGEIRCDRQQQVIGRLDVVGVGRAWGNKMNYVQREIRLDQYPWMYGIACELVTGDRAGIVAVRVPGKTPVAGTGTVKPAARAWSTAAVRLSTSHATMLTSGRRQTGLSAAAGPSNSITASPIRDWRITIVQTFNQPCPL